MEWCWRNDAYCIENDYENEFLYGTDPILSLQSMDRGNRVIYISSFSNILSSEIKCAFLVLPPKLLERYEDSYHYYRSAVPEFEQRALAQYIKDGILDRQSKKWPC